MVWQWNPNTGSTVVICLLTACLPLANKASYSHINSMPFGPAKPQSAGLATGPDAAMASAPCSISVTGLVRVGFSRAPRYVPCPTASLMELLQQETEAQGGSANMQRGCLCAASCPWLSARCPWQPIATERSTQAWHGY